MVKKDQLRLDQWNWRIGYVQLRALKQELAGELKPVSWLCSAECWRRQVGDPVFLLDRFIWRKGQMLFSLPLTWWKGIGSCIIWLKRYWLIGQHVKHWTSKIMGLDQKVPSIPCNNGGTCQKYIYLDHYELHFWSGHYRSCLKYSVVVTLPLQRNAVRYLGQSSGIVVWLAAWNTAPNQTNLRIEFLHCQNFEFSFCMGKRLLLWKSIGLSIFYQYV